MKNTDGFKRIAKRIDEQAEKAKEEISSYCDELREKNNLRNAIDDLENRVRRLEEQAKADNKSKLDNKPKR